MIVNFVVITKGSGRIAEVAARFHLDAMPGKQMAIDADLSAGLIDEAQAKTRRQELEDEGGFFGAMDGASKFVRGDAIAGLLDRVHQRHRRHDHRRRRSRACRSWKRPSTYTLLTVGDGLVTQVPALIVSTAAGLLVSKAGVSGAADKALMQPALRLSEGARHVRRRHAAAGAAAGHPDAPFLVLGRRRGRARLVPSARSSKAAAAAAQTQEVAAAVAAGSRPPKNRSRRR